MQLQAEISQAGAPQVRNVVSVEKQALAVASNTAPQPQARFLLTFTSKLSAATPTTKRVSLRSLVAVRASKTLQMLKIAAARDTTPVSLTKSHRTKNAPGTTSKLSLKPRLHHLSKQNSNRTQPMDQSPMSQLSQTMTLTQM